MRRLIKRDFDAAFDKAAGGCDAIICPTTTGPAFKFGQMTDDPLQMYLNDVYTVNANLAGIPGISLPAGFAQVSNGVTHRLPLGIQLFAPVFDEARLLRIARVLERATDLHVQRPSLQSSV